MEPILKLRRALSSNANAELDDVMAVKIFLQAQGFYEAPEWGMTDFPDRALFSAIEAFQKSKGLRVDGVMRPEGETENATQMIQAQALDLQDMGRNGDTILAHITPAEAKLLNQNGGSGTINPKTGLLEFSRFGGNNYSRDRAEKAQNKADSAARADSGNQRSGDWSNDRNRTLGYNDFNPGEAFGGNNRNGTAKTGAELDAHNRIVAGRKAAKEKSGKEAKAKQQQQVAEEHRKEQELQDEERRAFYNAMPDMIDPDEEDKMRTLSTKPKSSLPDIPNLSDERPVYGPPAPAQNVTQTKKQTNTRPTAAQQARNIVNARQMDVAEKAKQQKLNDQISAERAKAAQRAPGRTFTDAQFKGAAQANLSKAKGRREINDLISRSRTNSSNAQSQGRTLTLAQSLAHEIDKLRAEPKAKSAPQKNAPSTPPAPDVPTVPANNAGPKSWEKEIDIIRNGTDEQANALAKTLARTKATNPKTYDSLPSELRTFSEAVIDHKAKQNRQSPPKAFDPKYGGNPDKIRIAQNNHNKNIARLDGQAVHAGRNAISNYFGDSASGGIARVHQLAEIGIRAMQGTPPTGSEIKTLDDLNVANVPAGLQNTRSVKLGAVVGDITRALSELAPGYGDAVNAGEEAVRAVQGGATAKEVQTRATGVFAAGFIGGKIGSLTTKVARGLTTGAVKAGVTERVLNEGLGLAAGEGLAGAIGSVEEGKRPSDVKK